MKAAPCPIPPDVDPLLPGFDYADSFELAVASGRFDAVSAAHRALERGPAWVGALLGLRNLIVAPLGLRGTGEVHPGPRIGWFPLVSATPQRVVLGFDDKHLDFRIVLDVAPGAAMDTVRATTLVKRHNLAGRAYLATILPFHKAIVPVMLNRLG